MYFGVVGMVPEPDVKAARQPRPTALWTDMGDT